MNIIQRFFRYFEFLENIVPPKKRLPFRYYAQKTLSALEPEIAALGELTSKDRVSIDIGANKGIYTYALLKTSSSVHSFEPLRECCNFIENFHSPSVTVHNCALSDIDSTLTLYIPIDGTRKVYTRASLDEVKGDRDVRTVSVKRLDDFDIADIGFIKIDVEGVELAVLRGGAKLIQVERPNLLIEIDRNRHSEESFKSVFRYLYELGYQSFVYNNGMLDEAMGLEEDLSLTYMNFIFLPSEESIRIVE